MQNNYEFENNLREKKNFNSRSLLSPFVIIDVVINHFVV